ncbi:MAG: TIGR04255 family protein [Planctomycetes bacterium]|nr:TIGR04255 family protein [Planctomycetota bacterium]
MSTNKENPVIEAVVDFRFSSDLTTKQCEEFQGRLSQHLGEGSKPDPIVITKVAFEPEVDPTPSTKTIGYTLKGSAPETATQLRTNAFSFHMLAPYKNWETFTTIAREHFGVLFETKPLITRVAVRFINKLDASGIQEGGPARYIRLSPANPFGEIATLSSFVTQLDLQLAGDFNARITVALPDEQEPSLPRQIILDADVFQEYTTPITSAEAWDATLPKMRIVKNMIFQTTLTQEAFDGSVR